MKHLKKLLAVLLAASCLIPAAALAEGESQTTEEILGEIRRPRARRANFAGRECTRRSADGN